MGHRISFSNVETGWYNALPLGNGKFGAMVYIQNHRLHVAMNQYDCYYHVLAQYAKHCEGTENGAFDDPARKEKSFEEIKKLTDEARNQSDYAYSHYLRTLNPGSGKSRPLYQGGSYPQAGEVILAFSEKVNTDISLLELSIEEAKITFSAGNGNHKVEAEIYTAINCDGVVMHLSQSEPGLWETGDLWYQKGRGQKKYTYEKTQGKETCLLHCCFRPDGESLSVPCFIQESALYIPGAVSGEITALPMTKKFKLTASVRPGKGNGENCAKELWRQEKYAAKMHTRNWEDFWKSGVKLPDDYLETLWYLYVYLLECCSGKDSLHIEQACGLSGLWDIRRPCMWGSMWYWDVNIQTAFYGAFSSNHTEQALVFCKAFLSYREDAHKFARRIYGRDGWALDYPHPLYHCIQPWCALFLWKYYAYTRDRGFLEKEAYPAFVEILRFYETVTENDEKGIRHLDYDICPEQGPVGRDTVITTASVKQLIHYAIQSAEILKKEEEEIQWLHGLLESMPPYPTTGDKKRWKDSASVQDEIFLRHPSVLMPVFPAEEVHMDSDPAQKKLAEETLRYAQENTEPGTFGFPWLALAAARMGDGDAAVRLLYEKGLDFVTHSNGLAYEESERFINYCHLTKPANYLPVMCETAGGVTAAINFMLLQKIDGVIRLFPAVPDGTDAYEVQKTQYREDGPSLSVSYPAWDDCGFYGLLAPGAFEISAQRRKGRTVWIQIISKKGGRLRLEIPKELRDIASKEQGFDKAVLDLETVSGQTLTLGRKMEEDLPAQNTKVKMRTAARTHRRTFIGEDRDTAFYKALDAMLCPYGYAENLHYPMTPYVFDFTNDCCKNYDEVYDKQILEAGRSVLNATGPRATGIEKYNPDTGYGFIKTEGLFLQVRQKPDALRKDFVEGVENVEFGIELPAGKYDILVISGDDKSPSVTHLGIFDSGILVKGRHQAAGRYQCRSIPVIHEKDGVLRLSVSTDPGMKWKLNAIFINKNYMFL